MIHLVIISFILGKIKGVRHMQNFLLVVDVILLINVTTNHFYFKN